MLIEVGKDRPGLIAAVTARHGGRTVSLRIPGGPNLVDPGERDWSMETAEDVRPDTEWRQDFGQVVWLGPQSRFWGDQTAIPGRPAESQGWPPDPICTGAGYTLLESTPRRLRLLSPASPVWQVELTKTWEATPDGSIRFSVEAKNVSTKPIRKGLWFNFRATPSARVLVPVGRQTDLRVAGSADLRPAFENAWLSLHAPLLPDGHEATDAKAFLQPSHGVIRVEAPGGFLELDFPLTPAEAVAEGHAPVEIYRKANRDSWSILEVEQHAPCVVLGPGETMSHAETWRWVPGADM